MKYWNLDRWLVYWALSTITAVFTIPLIYWMAVYGHPVVMNYQTIMGALVAVFAAFIAYRSMQNQRAIADRQFSDQLKVRAEQHERKRLASTAALPMALARINDYAARCIYGLRDRAVQQNDGDSKNSLLSLLPQSPSDQTISIIKEAIEFAPLEMTPGLVGLLQELQIQLSRLRVLEDALARRPHNVFRIRDPNSNIVDALTLYAKSSVLFDYARGRSDARVIEVGYEEVYEAATRHGIFHRKGCLIFAEIFLRYPRPDQSVDEND